MRFKTLSLWTLNSQLGEGADSGTVVNLFVKEGDQIAKDQPILELENEKAVATIPSTAAGTVTKLYVKTGRQDSASGSASSRWAKPAPPRTPPSQPERQPRNLQEPAARLPEPADNPCRRRTAEAAGGGAAAEAGHPRRQPRLPFGRWRANWAST